MSVQGTYAPEVEIIGPKYGGDCWVVAGLPLDTLTEAVSTALANAGLVEFVDTRGGGIYLLQFEVKRQSLTHTHHHLGLGSYTATVVVSYSVSVSDLKSPIWKEEITGEHVVETGLAATPPNFGWRAQAHAIEGAVATNLRVLIRQLRELLLNKDCAADADV
jgi:hypothetical protein